MFLIFQNNKKLCFTFLVANKQYRKDLFYLTARSVLKNAKLFPDVLVGTVIKQQMRNEFEIKKNLYDNREIYKNYKAFVNFDLILVKYKTSFVKKKKFNLVKFKAINIDCLSYLYG